MDPPLDLAPLAHGGDLGAARRLFPHAPEPFLDLSTGINPHPYPLPQLHPTDRLAGCAGCACRSLAARHEILILNEAFMRVGREEISLCNAIERGNVVVLRCSGKFYGLAGLRLSFAGLASLRLPGGEPDRQRLHQALAALRA